MLLDLQGGIFYFFHFFSPKSLADPDLHNKTKCRINLSKVCKNHGILSRDVEKKGIFLAIKLLLYLPGNQINILPHNERGNIVSGF